MISEYVATAKIVDPSKVAIKATSEGITPHAGAIYIEIPELGFLNPDLIYCRYALSIPFMKIQEGWKVLVKPTVNDDSRWFFTGIVDCGDEEPTDDDQLIIQLLSQVIYASTGGTIHLSAKGASEPFILGDKFKTYIDAHIDSKYNTHTHPTTATVAATAAVGVIGPPVVPAEKPVDIYSKKIFGE